MTAHDPRPPTVDASVGAQPGQVRLWWYPHPLARVRPVVAIGTFDGVHLGHQAILQEACRLASEVEGACVALTFDPPPREVLQPESAPLRLTSLEQRLQLLVAFGAAACAVLEFDAALAALEPEAFVAGVLVRALGCRGAVAGYNFGFGRGRQGSAATLARLGEQHGLAVRVVAPVHVEGAEVSSSRARALVAQGKVREAAGLLGRPFSVRGQVVRGAGRGRQLGFPTANVAVGARQLLPADGVYVARLHPAAEPLLRPDQGLPALAVVSRRPTFGPGGERWLEVHALEQGEDWYGRTVEVAFLDFLRPIHAFVNAEELVRQIEADRRAALAFFRSHSLLRTPSRPGALPQPPAV